MNYIRNISLIAAILAVPVNAQASEPDAVVNAFEAGCFSSQEQIADNWYPVASDFDPGLKTYYDNIANLLGDKIVSHSHHAIFAEDRPIFLTRYQYIGHFGLSSQVCMVSDFSRDNWRFPEGLEAFLADKTIKTEHNVIVVESEKSVGHWRADESLRPISMITASAFVKDGPDHEASQFYGVQLTATRLNTAENNTLN